MSTLAIARIFFREAIRDRVLNLIWLFAIAVMLLSLFLGDLSAGSEWKVIQDMGLGTINMLLILVSIMIGAQSIHKEIDRRTVFVVLSKPIERWQFLLGKFLGLAGVLLLLAACMGGAFFGFCRLILHRQEVLFYSAIPMMFLEASVVSALAILFSTITNPTLTSIYTLGLYLVGHNTEYILTFGDRGETTATVRWIGKAIYHVIPNLDALNIKNQVVYGMGITLREGAWAAAYATAYVAIFLLLATLSFSRREL